MRLSIVMRHRSNARLFPLNDSLRRRPFHAGKKSRSRALAFNSHTVSGRLAQDRAVSRFRRRVAARQTSDDPGWSIPHQHGGGTSSGASDSAVTTERDETDRDGY